MAEEHRCQAPRLCANNCGFFGSAATQNLCSSCYRDLQLKEQQSSSAKLVLNLSSPVAVVTEPSSSSPAVGPSSAAEVDPPPRAAEEVVKPVQAAQQNRCVTCRKRVGLTGFRCRCGLMLCGSHRYPEQHGCEFDFKGLGREQIAKANPVVKAEKLDKI